MSDTREVIDSQDRSALPVFVDATGRRRRRLRRLGYAAAALCGRYSIMLRISLAGGPVNPQTLLPNVGGGGDATGVPSPKARPPPDAGPPAPPRPRRSGPVQAPVVVPVPRASGSAPPGAAPAPPASDERRTGQKPPAGTPVTTPSRPGGGPPAA